MLNLWNSCNIQRELYIRPQESHLHGHNILHLASSICCANHNKTVQQWTQRARKKVTNNCMSRKSRDEKETEQSVSIPKQNPLRTAATLNELVGINEYTRGSANPSKHQDCNDGSPDIMRLHWEEDTCIHEGRKPEHQKGRK